MKDSESKGLQNKYGFVVPLNSHVKATMSMWETEVHTK